MIASYDTVVSHSPCKLCVSIHKNKIEAGNWLSRAGERKEQTEVGCFLRREREPWGAHSPMAGLNKDPGQLKKMASFLALP